MVKSCLHSYLWPSVNLSSQQKQRLFAQQSTLSIGYSFLLAMDPRDAEGIMEHAVLETWDTVGGGSPDHDLDEDRDNTFVVVDSGGDRVRAHCSYTRSNSTISSSVDGCYMVTSV
jgi:hypothetical protein